MPKLTGLSATTPKHLLLDSGVFLKGAYRTKSAVTTAMADATKNLGVTNGGGSFNAVPEVRQATVDGGVTNIKDLMVIDSWNVTMVANVKEITVKNLQLALGATTVDTVTNVGFSTIEANLEIASQDYNDITWAGKLKGHENPVIIIIKNAISLNGLNLNVADKDEATVAITLTGCYDITDLETVPFEILYPNDDPTLSALTVTSTAGSTTGKTAITVSPAKASGNSYVYKTGTSAQYVTYDEVLSSWTAWDGSAQITPTSGHTVITVAEVTSENKARGVGSQTIVVA